MKWIDATLAKFLLVGVGNTLLSAALMFLLEGLGYWPSTALSYLVGACLSFFLHRHLPFQSQETLGRSALKFSLTVGTCYVLAYSIAQPVGMAILPAFGLNPLWTERLSKIGGMGLYTILNYFGQRFFAFSPANTQEK